MVVNMIKLKTMWISLLTMILAVILAAGVFYWNLESDKLYIERVTGINFPSGSILIQSHSDDETFILGQIQIPKASETDFLRNNDFQLNPQFSQLDVNQMQLPENMKPAPSTQGNFGHSGRSKYNTWQFLYDKKLAIVWCLVKFPDMSGDAP